MDKKLNLLLLTPDEIQLPPGLSSVLGPDHSYPFGQPMEPGDYGGLRVVMHPNHQQKRVFMFFGGGFVEWFGMSIEQAHQTVRICRLRATEFGTNPDKPPGDWRPPLTLSLFDDLPVIKVAFPAPCQGVAFDGGGLAAYAAMLTGMIYALKLRL